MSSRSLISNRRESAHSYGSNDIESNISNKQDDTETQTSIINKLFGSIDPRVISDLIIGLSDGLTVPFAPVSYTHLDVYKRQL